MKPKLKIALITAFAFFAGATAIFGQNIFQQKSLLSYYICGFGSVYSSDTGFIATGFGFKLVGSNILSARRLVTTWYDWNGSLVKQKVFRQDSTELYSMWYSANGLTENGFYNYGTVDDSTSSSPPNTSDVLLTRFNANFDTLWTKRYNSGYFDTGSSGAICENNDFVCVGLSTISNSNYCTRVIRFDSLGNIKWNFTYNCTYNNESRYIVKDEYDNFYIGGYTRPAGGSNPKNARTRILKIDSAGTVIWNKPMPGICDEYASAIDIAHDENLLLAKFNCQEQPTLNGIVANIALYKLDKNTGDTLWHKEYPKQHPDAADSPNFVRQLANGDIIIGGRGLQLFIENGDTIHGKYTGELIRTDSMGNLKWQRYYFYQGGDPINAGESWLSDGKQAPDGGFILVGRVQYFDNNLQFVDDGWIIKTDENGCIDLGCINSIEELEEDDFRLFIYPNPAGDYVNIDLPITHNKALLSVYNMSGQLVSQKQINSSQYQQVGISELNDGLYLLVVQNGDKVLGRQKLVVVK